MRLRFALLVLSAFLLSALTTTANAQDLLLVQDYRLTKKCKDIIDENGFDTFEIENDEYTLPTISVRDPESGLQINAVRQRPKPRNRPWMTHC